MANGAEGNDGALFAVALIEPRLSGRSLSVVCVATIRWQTKHFAHDRLPLLSMGSYSLAKQFVSDQMGDFVSHGLFNKVRFVFLKQHWIETQLMFDQ